jgi:hypothetical protein
MTLMKEKAYPGRVIYDHLQKTAGQAVNAWLAKTLGAGCVTPNLIGSHYDLIRKYGGIYSIISGHVVFPDNAVLDPRYQYVTCLREPIDRVVSWIYYLLRRVKPNKNTEFLIEGAKLFLASDGKEVSDGFYPTINNLYTEHFCKINGSGSEPDEVRLANALAALKSYDVVGLYEYLPDFLGEFSALLGFPAVAEIDRVNSTGERPEVNEISAALRERIAALNQLDLRLYAEVAGWKASAVDEEPCLQPAQVAPQWLKYELVRGDESIHERVVATPDVVVLNAGCREGHEVRHGQVASFDIEFYLAREVQNFQINFYFFDSDRSMAFCTGSGFLGQSYPSLGKGSYRASHHAIIDLPADKYTAGFEIVENLPQGRRVLAQRDRFHAFKVEIQAAVPFLGYSYLPSVIWLNETSLASAKVLLPDVKGYMTVVMPMTVMAVGERAKISVAVTNQSKQDWVGDDFHPVVLSYHWMDSSGVTHYEGLRTPLPIGGIERRQTAEVEMLVEAPHETGTYTLMLTLLQEHVMWFEDNGFKAARLGVSVVRSDE